MSSTRPRHSCSAASPTKASPPPGHRWKTTRASPRRPRCRSTSTRPPSGLPTGNNTTVLSGDFAAAIAAATDEVDGVIFAGSARLVQGLIAADLLGESRLTVFPSTLGGAKRLFTDDGRKVPLKLTDARTIGAGIQLLTYDCG